MSVDRTYTIEDVAEACGVSLKTAEEWQQEGKLRGFWEPLGEQFIFPLSVNPWFETFCGVPIEQIEPAREEREL